MNLLRQSMPALANKLYFNYGGQGPLPTPSLEAITNSWKKLQELGPFTSQVWPYITSEIGLTRKYLSDLCGVPEHRLSLTENVTIGCILPLWGLPFRSREHLLISDCEHPGIVAACKEIASRKNLEIDILPVEKLRGGASEQEVSDNEFLELLEKSLTKKTRLVVLSHILWNTGQLMPIAKAANLLSNHVNNPYLLVDGAQSFGQISIEEVASQADIYGFTGHKWACGPEGLGGVAISERVLIESKPTIIGWRSLKNEYISNHDINDCFHKDSRKFEIATSCIPLLAGLRCSLELLSKEGNPNQISSKICQKSSILWNLIDRTKNTEPLLNSSPPSGLVSFQVTSSISNNQIIKELGKKNIWIRSLEEPSCLRACLHVTSETREIEVLSSSLKELLN